MLTDNSPYNAENNGKTVNRRRLQMDKNMLSEYAKLMVKVGANVQKGQKVRLYAEVDQYELATLVARSATMPAQAMLRCSGAAVL